MKVNDHLLNLSDSYLFSAIGQKVKEYRLKNPDCKIISLGIGDVTRPLVDEVVRSMEEAVAEMAAASTFRGYGDEQGYLFLRQAICGYYAKKNVCLHEDEVFISDGAKSDLGNILDIFSEDNTVLIPDPSYPVYADSNMMAGRNIVSAKGNIENGFLPLPDPEIRPDLIYLCSPSNPTGAVYTREELKLWVEYALSNSAVILFDAAYEAFVHDPSLPTSIYQVEGAKECAIEFCSLSKTAGFSGVRCGYTVVPQELVRDGVSLNRLWLRRQTTKFNGVSYIVQRGAAAVFTDAGLAQVKENIAYYMENARLIAQKLDQLGIWHVGGENAPYIWLKCPDSMSSWDYFEYLLSSFQIVGTPGAGFGAQGEGFFRFSSFGSRENILEAMARLS
ncbi:MAG: LL-diaminopimelate aminotransferase [Bacillota bacterium]|nr:LL-diaminopimelate aminotransferase [Bacillota bacterium]